jgi:hypothetical protein
LHLPRQLLLISGLFVRELLNCIGYLMKLNSTKKNCDLVNQF